MFLHYWPAPQSIKSFFITHLRVTATSFIISAHLDDHEAIKYTLNGSLRSVYYIINYPNLLNISAGIPIVC